MVALVFIIKSFRTKSVIICYLKHPFSKSYHRMTYLQVWTLCRPLVGYFRKRKIQGMFQTSGSVRALHIHGPRQSVFGLHPLQRSRLTDSVLPLPERYGLHWVSSLFKKKKYIIEEGSDSILLKLECFGDFHVLEQLNYQKHLSLTLMFENILWM